MKKVILALVMCIAIPAAAQEPKSFTVTMTEVEIEAQARLNNIACKTVGLDDGGQTCGNAQALITKYAKAKQAKEEPTKQPP